MTAPEPTRPGRGPVSITPANGEGTADAWAAFDRPAPEPKHARTKKLRTSAANPRSTNPTHPYVDLIAEGFTPFRIEDPLSTVFGFPESIEVHEISHNPLTGTYAGFGPRVLRGGGLSVRPERVTVPADKMPADLIERLTP